MPIHYQGRVLNTLKELAEEFEYSISYLQNLAHKKHHEYNGKKRGQKWYFDRELFMSKHIKGGTNEPKPTKVGGFSADQL